MGFKVGDKLQHTGISDAYYKRDGIYEVIEVDDEEVRISNETGNTTWFTLSQVVSLFKRIDEPQQPQVTKVKLSQEQARALENAMKDNDIEYVITAHATAGEWVPDEKRALNELSVADLARALLIGYDVEQTAEEKLAEYYQERKKWAQQALERDERHSYAINAARAQAVNATLSLLGIKVKGIND